MSQNTDLLCEGIVGAVRARWALEKDLSLWKPWKRSEGRYGGERACLFENRGCISLWGNKSGIFHFGKPEAYFPYENQGVHLLVALWWHCAGNGLWYPLCISRHPLGDCHWDCSGDRSDDISTAAIAWADFFLSLFSFFFILLYIFLDCCWSACWFACWSTVVDCAGSPYFVGFFEVRLLVDLLVKDFVACLLLSVLIMKMEMPIKPRI